MCVDKKTRRNLSVKSFLLSTPWRMLVTEIDCTDLKLNDEITN